MKVLHVQSILGKIKSHLTCPKCSTPIKTGGMDMKFVSEELLSFSTTCAACGAFCDITAKVSATPTRGDQKQAKPSFSVDTIKTKMAELRGGDVRALFEERHASNKFDS